ncbi:hypothetical protein RRG08_061142 [Elysia crispata]|uniref:Uncharacterized protein n=1 Tax=Elysia crispata TaxID=231223 RepID=A0AAE1CEN6_9GAST|nr:hypothetical protein RRG08_061142 [Elysia crispata]
MANRKPVWASTVAPAVKPSATSESFHHHQFIPNHTLLAADCARTYHTPSDGYSTSSYSIKLFSLPIAPEHTILPLMAKAPPHTQSNSSRCL